MKINKKNSSSMALTVLLFLALFIEMYVFNQFVIRFDELVGTVIKLLLMPVVVLTLFSAIWKFAEVVPNGAITDKVHKMIKSTSLLMGLAYIVIILGAVSICCST